MFIIKTPVQGEVYTFLLRKNELVGESLCLVVNEMEYVLLHEDKAIKSGIILTNQLRKELFEGWLWINVNEFGLNRRKVTKSELEIYKYIKQNINIDLFYY
ncbi:MULTISPECIES: hypothetical protein [unclassified Bacillus (in: firmicutes)]|uniref:hypothetical protein n=1 Tax=unclassified Bacillus (in: firmicutes) TaxID=185979 RepID=UPI001CEF7015|nr:MULTISPECIES: hypothetical protein [unclassified Bacillus (in: firmicutes)]